MKNVKETFKHDLVSITHKSPSSSFSCSAAGSYSSSLRASSFKAASSASLLAARLSASLIALASDSRLLSSSLSVLACALAEGIELGRVEDVRAASRTRESAIVSEEHEYDKLDE